MDKKELFIVVLVGQKNVGKSTLFNRLTQNYRALVADYFGVTRDRQYGYIQHKNDKCIIVDTGGVDESSDSFLQNAINYQTNLAIREADIVLFVVNGRAYESSIDYNIIGNLRKLGKNNIFVVINKIDNFRFKNKNLETKYSYYSFGIKEVIVISAMHGYGIDILLDKIFLKIKKEVFLDKKNTLCLIDKKNKKTVSLVSENNSIKLAVVGRPNSGKSTFINYVVQESRVITSSIPGTTRDSVYIPIICYNQKYMLIDTAGIRRGNNKYIDNLPERISVLKTFQVIKDAHVILLIIDINEGIVDQDLSLLNFIIRHGRSLVIALNKWDNFSPLIKNSKSIILQSLTRKLNFLGFSTVKMHFISSLYGYGVKLLFKSIEKIHFDASKIINTVFLTSIMNKAITECTPPFVSKVRGGGIPKFKYVHIGGYDPITIIIYGTQINRLPNEYRKYLKKYFCRALNFDGIFFHLKFKEGVKSMSY
ncbi:GTP-binding protein engA [Candidatus Blochmanniella vafra str. BVAF]|uniref:GTPase Der n=1 Tax=Blochmanniella vafra (strain BVAF) TaxID=859654 RepID=E8Q6E4_BLOVB|nr:ribosome biogenesis GTPase Der [Candidatus Blochmannia vafer]ADV33913.1 GTP-binding protein engA [Candidatus Blochmannia vafer str. BVAF]